MKKSTFLLVMALVAVGVGMGAGIAASLVSLRSKNTPQVEPEIVATSNVSICSFNTLTDVTNSLHKAKSIEAIALDPLPTLVSFANNLSSDLIATLNPAPWPQISDRARQARVPIIMYHDITAVKQVDWDVTPEELALHFQAIQDAGMTPISMDRLVDHLRTGASLPEKPVLLTFDDNYLGQYQYAFPLLRQYNYPAVWSVHTGYVGKLEGKPKATWDQLREMQQSGLITIASHTVNHLNLSDLDDDKITKELVDSKQTLERELGIPIQYFTYPEGSYSDRVKEKVKEVGYKAALTMSLNPRLEQPANTSEDMLAIRRYGQSRLQDAISVAWNGLDSTQTTASSALYPTTFSTPVQKKQLTVDGLGLTLVYGGKPVTVHADTRGQVADIMKSTPAIAAVDGGFFSLESLQDNKMIGPVLSQFSSQAGVLNPGRKGENPLLKGRPLVLISPDDVRFVPYDPDKHATQEQLQAELPSVTDAFVGAGWLVRDGKPQPAESFGKLYGFDAHRDRAFWGIDRSGRPVIGVTMDMIDSVGLGVILAKAGLYNVVMLDSGASAALAYRGKSVMSYEPRPVPHIVALLPPEPKKEETQTDSLSCPSGLNTTGTDSTTEQTKDTSTSE
ncbi:polysaccharide deacetylase family protein [Pseudanabaena sp. PCC 6802]|uniref:polysaccharide deacetylase family protein n=1 Tax=Pseudanabaena sp. PCC 6802 TaxID=118173 RepID=UPI0012EA7397|nr:polysaccharide deacetylase family protein [Pseudanabaena sp. PCC 6802]